MAKEKETEKNANARKSIKEILLAYNQTDTIEDAESIAQKEKKPLHQVMVERNFASGLSVLEVIAQSWGTEYIDLSDREIDKEIVSSIPEPLCRRHNIAVFEKTADTISLAMLDPFDATAVEAVESKTKLTVKPYLALPQDIGGLLDKTFGKGESEVINELLASVGDIDTSQIELQEDEEKSDITEVNASASEVEKFVNAIILGALNWGASDIHIEPFEDPAGKNSKLLVRYRVDGMLAESNFRIPWSYRAAIIAKIKIMTNSMDITERRIPQSGRIQLLAKGNPIEFRVEVIPSVYGESCVMRILDRKAVQVDIAKLMFLKDTEEKFLGLLKGIGGKKNFGIILVCGPTGSGKSTTLYAALNYVNRPDIKVITAENPVEYNIDGILQVPVNPEIKLGEDKKFDFASALRSFLRLDPDVIMVGEIRDSETAHIAMEAAMTGHLVLSTIHTNDAPSAVARLVEMGMPAYIVAATTKAVLAQRLARKLCSDCKKPVEITEADALVFKQNSVEIPKDAKLYKPVGCPECKDSGFKGRLGIHELLVMSPQLCAISVKTSEAEPLRAGAVAEGMRSMIQDGLTKVLQGHTTIREIMGGIEDVLED